jgi:PAS domain S-box-containing protein
MKWLIIIGGIIMVLLGIMLAVISLLGRSPKQQKKKKKKDPLASSLHDEKLKSDIILNAIEDGVVLIDSDNNIRAFNPGASRISGWPAKEAAGLDFHLVLKFTDEKGTEYTDVNNPLAQVFQQKSTIRDHHATLVSRSNKHIAVNLSVSPLLDDSGEALNGAVAVFRDVSKERGEERQRAEFISTASHEMRTPVAAIEGYLSLAMNDKVAKIDSKARDYLEKAHSSTQHLGQLFQDLLTSAKAEDGRLSNHPVVVEMGSYLEQLVEDLKFTAQKKSLALEFTVGTANQTIDASGGGKVIKPLYYVHVDPDRLREVITNLFDNAVKYTDTGKISVGLTGNNEVVQFYIKDTGPGIPNEDISHLFEKFYRVDNSATRTIGGTGLGLFICRKIVELYSGRIWVESELEKGSTFFINLPRLTNQKANELKLTEVNNNASPEVTSLASS